MCVCVCVCVCVCMCVCMCVCVCGACVRTCVRTLPQQQSVTLPCPLPRPSHPRPTQHLANSLLLLSQAYGDALEAAGGEPAAPGLVEEALALRAAARGIMRDVVGDEGQHLSLCRFCLCSAS